LSRSGCAAAKPSSCSLTTSSTALINFFIFPPFSLLQSRLAISNHEIANFYSRKIIYWPSWAK
jgi:hypothetical protein